MVSFTSFNSLKIFQAAAIFLQTDEKWTERDSLIDVFPHSLETLHLNCFHSRLGFVLEAVKYLIAQKSLQQILSLKKLILVEKDVKDVNWPGRRQAIRSLSRLAVAQGITLELR